MAPFTSSTIRAAAGKQARDVSLTPWANSLNGVARAAYATGTALQVWGENEELSDEQLTNLFLAWMAAGGQLTGAPVVQAGSTIRYWKRTTGDESTADHVYGTMFGPKDPWWGKR